MAKNMINFDEDTFDLEAHKKTADALIRKKSRIKRARRIIAFGKVVLTILAFAIAILSYYLITNFVF